MRRLLQEKKTALDGSCTANSLRAQEENLNISKRTLQNYQVSKLHLKYAKILLIQDKLPRLQTMTTSKPLHDSKGDK